MPSSTGESHTPVFRLTNQLKGKINGFIWDICAKNEGIISGSTEILTTYGHAV